MIKLTKEEAFIILSIIQVADFSLSTIEEMQMLVHAYEKLQEICNAEIKAKPQKHAKADGKKNEDIDKGKVKALRTAGWTLKDIAEDVGCSTDDVRQILNME